MVPDNADGTAKGCHPGGLSKAGGFGPITLLARRAVRFGFFGRPPSCPFSRAALAFAALLILPSATAAGFFFFMRA